MGERPNKDMPFKVSIDDIKSEIGIQKAIAKHWGPHFIATIFLGFF